MKKKTLGLILFLLAMTLVWGQTTLINWNFENATKRAAITNDATFISSPYTADAGIIGNVDTKIIKSVGRPTFTSSASWVTGSGGSGTYAPNLVSWNDGNGSKCWQISLVTTGYAGLTLSSKQYGSSTGPRDFKLQYSLNETDWVDVSNGSVTVSGNWSSGVLNGISLPTECDNQPLVYLRWIMTSNTSVNGNTVASTGTNRIDDIIVTGVSGSIPELVVTPGNLSGFTYIVGNGPSPEQYFSLSGTNLSANVVITAPVDYEISQLTGAEFVPTNPISLVPAAGTLTATNINVRLKALLTAGTYSAENINITTTGVSQSVACSGSVTTPVISVSQTSLSGFTYMLSMGPSGEQSFFVGGTNLYNDLIITAPLHFEVSTVSEGEFSPSLALTPVDNIVPTTTIYVRLKADLPLGTYNTENITLSSTGATDMTVTCSGSVTTGTSPSAPVATDATNLTPTSFTANWNSTENAAGYRLDVYTGSANEATDLFISEYVEGSSNNKYIELFNGTGAAVDLSNYQLKLFANGATNATNTVSLTGTLQDGTCVVYKNSSATLTLPAGVTATNSTACNYNGNDAVALYKISTTSYVDIFGRIGEDPSTAWGTDPLITLNKTLVRKSTVISGVTTNPTAGFPTLATEWNSFPIDTATYLGSHTMGSRSISYVTGYQNLSVGDVTSYPVSGLAEVTDYHYVVRAVNTFGTSPNSNEIDVSTPSSTAPVINLTGTLSPFTATVGTPSATQSYTLSGAFLTSSITLIIPAGFEVSTNGGTSYFTSTTSVPASFSGTVLVRLTATANGTYSGSIAHTSDGAITVNLTVSGTVTGGPISAPTVQASGITGYPALTSISLEWTPGNGEYRIVKINTVNTFTAPTDGTSPTANTVYAGSGQQVVYNGATEFVEGDPFNGCTVTNLTPNTTYWFRIYDYNGTATETRFLTTTATNNPKSVTTSTSSGSGYYSTIYGTGTTLKTLLHTLIKGTHTTQYSYDGLKTQLPYTDEDPANSNNLIEIYTGWSIPKADFGSGTTDWNREHTWSKSHGNFGDVAPAGTDLHHLRPCDATVNSRKNNKDFDAGGTAYTDASPPSGYTGTTGCFDTTNTWEPRDADKGDVARMIMYMAVRYDGDDSNFTTNLELVDYTYSDAGTYQPYYGKLSTLLQWHVQDPPDAWEVRRNNRIAERQGNRNPFIDMPGYAARIWTPCPISNTNITTTSFTGNWSTPISATDYYLQVAADSLFTNPVAGYNNLDVNLVTSYGITGLTPGATYYYRLRSFFIDGYSMYSPYLAVTLSQPVVATATITPSQALEEINLAGSTLVLMLQNTTFTDAGLSLGNFSLNNAPAGLSISNVSYVNSTTAILTLAFTGADFDNNVTGFSVTVADAEIAVSNNLTTAVISIIAHVEGIASIALEGSLIRLTITPVTGAASYRIFASTNPYGVYSEVSGSGTFDPGSPNIWRLSATLNERRFFKVSAIRN